MIYVFVSVFEDDVIARFLIMRQTIRITQSANREIHME